MTREQYHSINKHLTKEHLIDLLYDTINKYENRSCEGCKHSSTNEITKCGMCSRMLDDCWEKRDE